MIAWLWLRIQKYVYMAGAVAVAVLAAMAYGWIKGKEHAAGKVREARQKVAQAKAHAAVSDDVAAQIEARMKVDAKVQELANQPDAGKRIDAAGGGWVRDGSDTSEQD